MAWMIDEAVIRGEIDNRVEGRTKGRVWLVDRKDPLELDLDGDCWRDLAGTRLFFKNPEPKRSVEGAGGEKELEQEQRGLVGDMTASRKCKVPTVSEDELQRLYENEEDIPFAWKNTLYLEWFSESNGRVVIEATNFELEISERDWEMDEDAEEAQKLANLNAMRDFMAQVIGRREEHGGKALTDGEADEFAWEERLKESDRLTDAYQEVLEKYMEDADCERKEAFVMGWDGLLDALAERDEAGDDVDPGDESFFGSQTELDEAYGMGDTEDGGFSGTDYRDDADDKHPLQEKAQELALRAMDLVQRDAGPGTPAYRLVSHLLQVSGKLAGALNGRGSGYEPENGFVLAVLKRCLSWLNEAVGACQELMAVEDDKDQYAALNHVRASAFDIRAGIVELRRELK